MTIEQQIRLQAYELWLAAGMGEGDAERHWLQAELAVTRESAAAKLATAKKPAVKAKPAKSATAPKPSKATNLAAAAKASTPRRTKAMSARGEASA